MNVNVKLSLTDEQRNVMYRNMTGKDVKRMVSRAEVNEFVRGCLAAVVEDAPVDGEGQPIHEVTQLTASEMREVKRLQEAGHNASYIRGWLQVMRRCRAPKV